MRDATRVVASALASLAVLNAVTAIVAWHSPWLVGHLGPLEAADFVGLFTGWITFVLGLLLLRGKGVSTRALFFGLPSGAVAVVLVATAATGVAGAILANRRASGFSAWEHEDRCWRIGKDHGAILRCVSHEEWLAIQRFDRLGNIAGLVIALSLEAALLTGAALRSSEPG